MATSSTQTLALGCRDSERVRFDYRAANGSPSSRRVEPHQLVPLVRVVTSAHRPTRAVTVSTSCTLTMDTDSLDGPLFALGSLGAEFTVVAPPELTALAADWGARLVRSSLR